MGLPTLIGSKLEIAIAEKTRNLILTYCPEAVWLLSQTNNALSFPHFTNIKWSVDDNNYLIGHIISVFAQNINIPTFNLESGTYTMRRKWTRFGKVILTVVPRKEGSIIMLLKDVLSEDDYGFAFEHQSSRNPFEEKNFPWYKGTVTVFPKNKKGAAVFSIITSCELPPAG